MKRKITGDEYFFEILVFLATSARGCVDEPPLYGPFRLIDALSKLIDLPDYAPCLKKDNFTMEVKRDIDEKKLSVMFDAEEFKKLLDKIVSQLTKELKKRMSQVH